MSPFLARGALFAATTILSALPARSQTRIAESAFEYGLMAKLELGAKNNTSFTVSGCLGFGRQFVFRGKRAQPDKPFGGAMISFKFGVNLYRGGIGNSKLPSLFDDHQLDLYNSFAISPGFYGSEAARDRMALYRRPFYTWNANNADCLTNPWQFSTTLATNFVWNVPINGRISGSYDSEGNGKPRQRLRRSQRVGFWGFAFDRFVSLGYYNDGPPFSGWLGDGLDRYWTGGGFVHFGAQKKLPGGDSTGYAKNLQFVWSFDKFTGYESSAYEIANKLKLKRVPYKDKLISSYNRGIMRFSFMRNESALTVSRIDIRAGRDIQDLIHRLTNAAYHPNIYGASWLIGGRYLLGGPLAEKKP